ncbi:Rid family detoxifying hydrolase [Laedolimicola intestinihominis]|uniref:RidA family protein n=1 Tax=Laedolimicola intestinihominis TaxID=3133166 RepID=A0ABV1FEC4_9FIRM|nr:RidA family protein [Lachnospiraceae bacterium]
MKKVIATTNAPAAIGPYSQAIEYNGMVYASGQIPVNPATGEVESDNIEGQADQSLKNVGAILKEAGLDYSNVIKTTCFLADIADFAKFNEVYSRYFKEEAPARSCVAVKDLPKGVLCEVEVIAGR